jgi:hypothetical protein
VTECLNNPQGGGEETKQLIEAQAKLEELLKAAEEARTAEDKAKAAEVEAKAAAAELHRQEEEFKNQVTTLEAKSTNMSLGQVARNMAVQDLAALKGSDPLPLRRAKITQDVIITSYLILSYHIMITPNAQFNPPISSALLLFIRSCTMIR